MSLAVLYQQLLIDGKVVDIHGNVGDRSGQRHPFIFLFQVGSQILTQKVIGCVKGFHVQLYADHAFGGRHKKPAYQGQIDRVAQVQPAQHEGDRDVDIDPVGQDGQEVIEDDADLTGVNVDVRFDLFFLAVFVIDKFGNRAAVRQLLQKVNIAQQRTEDGEFAGGDLGELHAHGPQLLIEPAVAENLDQKDQRENNR